MCLNTEHLISVLQMVAVEHLPRTVILVKPYHGNFQINIGKLRTLNCQSWFGALPRKLITMAYRAVG